MICAARKGFLTLSDCGEPAATMCANCGRPMCAKHLSPTSGFTNCYDCTATTAPQEEGQQGQGQYDDAWAHRYRDDYYRTSGYTPMTYYDSHDRTSFDSRQDDFGEDEVERGGFGAS